MRIILLAVLISFFFASPARAEEDEYSVKREKAEKHTQKIIEACEAPSREDWDSGVTSRMREGSYKKIECLTKEINSIAKTILHPDEVKEFSEYVDKYTENSYYIYNTIHNSNKSCTPCGTMYHVLYLGDVTEVLENLLKRMLLTAYFEDILQ